MSQEGLLVCQHLDLLAVVGEAVWMGHGRSLQGPAHLSTEPAGPNLVVMRTVVSPPPTASHRRYGESMALYPPPVSPQDKQEALPCAGSLLPTL